MLPQSEPWAEPLSSSGREHVLRPTTAGPVRATGAVTGASAICPMLTTNTRTRTPAAGRPGARRGAGAQRPRYDRGTRGTAPAQWTPATYMMAANTLGYIEPDPGVEWTRRRINDLITAVSGFSTPDDE